MMNILIVDAEKHKLEHGLQINLNQFPIERHQNKKSNNLFKSLKIVILQRGPLIGAVGESNQFTLNFGRVENQEYMIELYTQDKMFKNNNGIFKDYNDNDNIIIK